VIKERRTQLFLQQEAEKQENLQKKLHIIERIKEMGASPEEANKNYNEFKELQQHWKEIKNVPADKANELWRNYQLYVEQYYDLLNLNREAREYDFKKNLEKKTKLCEAAEKLADESDVISAFHQLQDLAFELLEDKSVLLVTHDPQEALRLSHRIFVLRSPETHQTALSELILPEGNAPRELHQANLWALQQQLLRELGGEQ